jgi:Transposase DDE domain
VAYVRTVKTARGRSQYSSGAVAVQIVWSSRRGSRNIEHVGSTHDEAEVQLLKAAAQQRIVEGQGELDLGLDPAEIPSGPLEITGSRAGYLWEALCLAYEALGLDRAASGDEVFRDLVLARIIEPTSKVDSLRVLAETGIGTVTYRTLTRRLPGYAKASFRAALSAACTRHAGLGPASLVLYDVTTLYFETDTADGFREPGFSKERRLEPQITVGLLTDATGFPLAVAAFKGNEPETDTMLPVINAFKAAHQLTDVTVVADAGMISEANQKAIQAAGLSFILGTRIAYVPQVITEWRDKHPGQEIPDQQVFTQPWPATASEKARGIPDRVIYYQYRHDRARRTWRGIDEQVTKAEKAVAGNAPVKRNRFIKLTGATKSVNRDLEAKARALAGIKGYTTNLTDQTPEFIIGAYHQLWRIEKSFRMSKHDLQARPIYHHKRESIEAHLSIVFAALAVSHWIERQTGWSIKKFIQTLRRYRIVTIRAGNHTLTAADPLPADLQDILAAIASPNDAPSDSAESSGGGAGAH